MKNLIVLVIIAIVFILAYLFLSPSLLKSEADNAKNLCIQKCQKELNVGRDLSNGPCLSNEIMKDWVCDVAHSPRQAVDNLKENQCSAYGKTASHFVEVDPSCNFIIAV